MEEFRVNDEEHKEITREIGRLGSEVGGARQEGL